jgi:hypothetical protein
MFSTRPRWPGVNPNISRWSRLRLAVVADERAVAPGLWPVRTCHQTRRQDGGQRGDAEGGSRGTASVWPAYTSQGTAAVPSEPEEAARRLGEDLGATPTRNVPTPSRDA